MGFFGNEFVVSDFAGRAYLSSKSDSNGILLYAEANTNNDENIEFYIGGYAQENLKMRTTYDGNTGFNSNLPRAVVDINALLRLQPVTAPPAPCSAATKGSFYIDNDISRPCFCNGTAWVDINGAPATCS
jgi:hypothetical protein